MNIEHRTSNVQHRIMYSVNFKKKTEKSESTLRNSIRLSRSTLSFSTQSSQPKGSSQAAVRLF